MCNASHSNLSECRNEQISLRYMAKASNATSQAISAVSQELGQVREAVLENRAAIDCLLLRHNHGCGEFKGLLF